MNDPRSAADARVAERAADAARMSAGKGALVTDPDAIHFMDSAAWASELFAAYGERGIKEEDQAEWMLRGVMVAIGIHDARTRLPEGESMNVTFDEALTTGIRLADQWGVETLEDEPCEYEEDQP